MPPALAEMAVPMTVDVTSYCDRGLTASGVMAGPGIAGCDVRYPFGTLFYLSDGSRWVCQDRGIVDGSDWLDTWRPTCGEAWQWGRQRMAAWRIE